MDYHKSIYRLSPREDKSITKIKLVSGNEFIFSDIYKTLSYYKNKIDDCKKIGNWDKVKKKVNKYELVNIIGTNNFRNDVKINTLSYSPLSRAFFKLVEIYKDIDIIPEEYKNKSGYIANIAEGPGGFIEGIHKCRTNNNITDLHYALTLYAKNSNIPGWEQIKRKKDHQLHKNPKILLKTGSLYELTTIRYFSNFFNKQKAFLVTADGGFDYSSDFNNQELNSLKIIYAEIVQTLMIQEVGGTFVLKMFDLFTHFALQMVYLLNILYEEVYIIKPVTSRPANSEKYIVAKKFKGINNSLLSSMVVGLNNWKNKYYYIQNIIIPEDFIAEIKKINIEFVNKQTKHINKIISTMRSKKKVQIKDNESYSLKWLNDYNILNKNEIKEIKFKKQLLKE